MAKGGCWWCGTSLAGRRLGTRWCSKACRTYWVRRERRRTVVLARPRCMICSGPMPYRQTWQGPGVNLSATTCSLACHIKRVNWFKRAAA